MKLYRQPAQRASGNTLVLTMVFGFVTGIVLLSYLMLIQGRMKVRARSLAWNAAIPVLEQGIEEAFTHLQDDSNNLTLNSWTQIGSGATTTYRRARTNSDNSFFIVTISNATTWPYAAPVVYSQGFVPAPLKQGYISRLVRVGATNPIVYLHAIAARNSVDLNGQTVVDSYDPNDPNYSTNGQYDAAKRKAGGSVVTDSSLNPSIDVGNGHIYGTVSTGPGGTVSTTAGGSVGDVSWSSTHTGVQSGYSADDMNVFYPDPQAPAGSGSWLTLSANLIGSLLALIGGTNYNYTLSADRIYNGDFSLNSSDKMIVTANATLYVTGNFSISGNAYIYIAPGASLSLYVGGSSTSISGGGVINGSGGGAANFAYYGLPNNTSIKYTGQADFVGTINAPEAAVTLAGGADIYGAVICYSFSSKSAGAGVHFDESLAARSQLKLLSYREL